MAGKKPVVVVVNCAECELSLLPDEVKGRIMGRPYCATCMRISHPRSLAERTDATRKEQHRSQCEEFYPVEVLHRQRKSDPFLPYVRE